MYCMNIYHMIVDSRDVLFSVSNTHRIVLSFSIIISLSLTISFS